MKTKSDRYIDYINANILSRIDYEELQESYSTPEKAYAKGVLNLLHQGMVQIYGSEVLRSNDSHNSEEDFVLVPGVVQGVKSGSVCLALLELDLSSSGEHWNTDFLTKHGVIPQSGGEKVPEALMQLMGILYLPYEYGYTTTIPDDIHIRKSNLPAQIKEMLQTFKEYTAELLLRGEVSVSDEFEDDMER